MSRSPCCFIVIPPVPASQAHTDLVPFIKILFFHIIFDIISILKAALHVLFQAAHPLFLMCDLSIRRAHKNVSDLRVYRQ